MLPAKILVVDDEEKMRQVIGIYLGSEGYQIEMAANGKEALEKFEAVADYDLILLDVMMPEIDGWTVCREIRRTSRVPIILLTARGEDYDKLFGFELGIDDYMTKPFNLKELNARVKAVLRRVKDANNCQQQDIVEGVLLIKSDYRQAFLDGDELVLTPKEYDLLHYMSANPQIVYSREQLLSHVWGYDFAGDTRTVDTHIKQLRDKLGVHKDYIRTVWGTGYKFKVGDVDEKPAR